MGLAYIATMQIVVPYTDDMGEEPGVDCPAGVSDFLNEFLEDNNILDWQYLSIGGQLLTAKEIIVPDNYQEGDAFD